MPLQPQISGTRHMIVAGHYLASQAGHAVLEAGGNAVDAAGGGGHRPRRRPLGPGERRRRRAHDRPPRGARRDGDHRGLGPWPEAARLETCVEEHGGKIPLGLLRTVVPAAPDAWILALERHTTMGFGDVAAAAIRYAREGFTMHPVMAEYITRYRGRNASHQRRSDSRGASSSAGCSPSSRVARRGGA